MLQLCSWFDVTVRELVFENIGHFFYEAWIELRKEDKKNHVEKHWCTRTQN